MQFAMQTGLPLNCVRIQFSNVFLIASSSPSSAANTACMSMGGLDLELEHMFRNQSGSMLLKSVDRSYRER